MKSCGWLNGVAPAATRRAKEASTSSVQRDFGALRTGVDVESVHLPRGFDVGETEDQAAESDFGVDRRTRLRRAERFDEPERFGVEVDARFDVAHVGVDLRIAEHA
jgi:hypothetical protein